MKRGRWILLLTIVPAALALGLVLVLPTAEVCCGVCCRTELLIVDAASGQPIPNATVDVLPDLPPPGWRSGLPGGRDSQLPDSTWRTDNAGRTHFVARGRKFEYGWFGRPRTFELVERLQIEAPHYRTCTTDLGTLTHNQRYRVGTREVALTIQLTPD
jgi:hypothetical protein